MMCLWRKSGVRQRLHPYTMGSVSVGAGAPSRAAIRQDFGGRRVQQQNAGKTGGRGRAGPPREGLNARFRCTNAPRAWWRRCADAVAGTRSLGPQMEAMGVR